MQISTTVDKKRLLIRTACILIWLLIWQLVATLLDSDIILVSPLKVTKTLLSLSCTLDFYQAILFSLKRIVLGFLIALVISIILSVLSYKSQVVKYFFQPIISIIKSVPVASFIIIVLVWTSSKNLSIIISFLIVLPVLYTNILQGLNSVDVKLFEMAEVFEVSNIRKIRYIYLPCVMPFFKSACTVALGLAWKSGIAAEVIGLPRGSMGEHLYNSKIFLDTASLLSWTVVIVLVSFAFEKLFLKLVDLLAKRLNR